MFIGKWNRTVVLTYLGVFLSASGIILGGRPAALCLIGAGLCDLLDGPVARRASRTQEEKAFGKNLDSLADALGFVALPVSLLASLGCRGIPALAALGFYAVCGVCRLADFGIRDGRGFTGLPVTWAAALFPVLVVLDGLLHWGPPLYLAAAVLLGAGFIANVPVAKPGPRTYPFFFLLAALAALGLWLL